MGRQWEDEASTTIEHGQVADKLRPLPPTRPGNVQNTGNVTQTNAGLDDHTVDDQSLARDVLSAITPLRAEPVARLAITQGNDVGQDIEIRAGKTYTIGRGIDNDVVLTDISVSRKHFDLKHEDGAWVIVDRGSGNGTVVNGNLEDNPFMLATGDVIEIGNTVFRFEQPNGAPRVSAPTYDLEDEELSTVAGKPVRDEEEPLPAAPPRPVRPKTMPPPPVPMRPTNRSTPPPLSAYMAAAQQQALGQPTHLGTPASTMPMAQMANRAPLGAADRTVLGDSMGMPMPMQGHPHPVGMAHTIGGQGAPMRPSFPYPQAAEIPPHSVHAQMLIQQTHGRRGDGSTAHVQPVPYMGGMPMHAQPRGYEGPQLSRRTKLLLAGIGLAVLTGVVTAAVMKSGSKPKASAAATAKAGKTDSTKTTPNAVKQQPTVEPIKEAPKQEAAKIATVTPPKQEPTPTVPPQKTVAAEPPKQEPPKQIVEAPKQVVKQEPKQVVKQEPKREKKRESRREPVRETSKRVAAADVDGAEEKADGLYRDRNFNGAAKVLAEAARGASDDEAKGLRLKSDKYAQLGKVYAQGTAPAQKANVAFEYLRQASNYDRNLGNAFDSDLQTRLAAVAPKAAVAYLAQQKYEGARSALIVAKQLGSTDSNLQLVKQKLEAVAGDLYNEAAKEIGSDPTAAKEKLRKLKTYVDAKSTWAVKADALLKKS
jgi:pSer/pThr/pTyr-binding forkhead associated (FHA) protein